jgi:hypothetical protein
MQVLKTLSHGIEAAAGSFTPRLEAPVEIVKYRTNILTEAKAYVFHYLRTDDFVPAPHQPETPAIMEAIDTSAPLVSSTEAISTDNSLNIDEIRANVSAAIHSVPPKPQQFADITEGSQN